MNLIDSIINKRLIKIALLAPFKLDQIELDSVENTKNYLKNLNLTTISLDFYSGAIMALGKGKENGINFELEVIDTKNDYDSIIKILSQNSF